jgi:hypothetical protein
MQDNMNILQRRTKILAIDRADCFGNEAPGAIRVKMPVILPLEPVSYVVTITFSSIFMLINCLLVTVS